jgi:hypothetical protein
VASPNEQLEAMRRLAENWDGYGAAVPSATVVDLAEGLMALVEMMLKRVSKDSPPLHVSPTRNGGILIEWEERAMQHEIEINPDRSIGFLHLDKTTGQIETRKFTSGPLHPGLLQELRHMLAA